MPSANVAIGLIPRAPITTCAADWVPATAPPGVSAMITMDRTAESSKAARMSRANSSVLVPPLISAIMFIRGPSTPRNGTRAAPSRTS